jgi:hypothetical protein
MHDLASFHVELANRETVESTETFKEIRDKAEYEWVHQGRGRKHVRSLADLAP